MNTKIIASALHTNGYYLDATTNTLYVTAPFEKKSNVYGTQEYRLVSDILTKFPDVQISVQKKSRKEVITFELMEAYIRIMPDAVSNLAEFEQVKLKSHAFRSPYKYVVDWFFKKNPNYGKFMVKDATGKVVWNITELYKQAAEQQKQEALKKVNEESRMEGNSSSITELPVSA